MTSALEITSPTVVTKDSLGPVADTLYTQYPFSQTYFKFVKIPKVGEIQPYMARVHPPVRVTFTPSAMGTRRKSRVTDAARSAIINYRPLKVGDQSAGFRFRAPDATLPTLQYLSPWISVTKTDYKDPRFTDSDLAFARDYTPGLFPRSYTDGSIDLLSRNTPVVSRKELIRKSELTSKSRSRTTDTKETSAKTASSLGKRVKIQEPKEAGESGPQFKPVHKSVTPTIAARLKDLKEPDSGVNYYSGYLPTEYSGKIAEKLKINDENSIDENNVSTDRQLNYLAQFYKPLVGDRRLFMHESYPTQPKVLQSDIDQLRLQGRKRFMQSHGQAPTHFSALKNRGTLARPKQKGVRLDEAVREQQRQVKTPKNSRKPAQATSLEIFQQQRDRTYNLQNQAKEMIKK